MLYIVLSIKNGFESSPTSSIPSNGQYIPRNAHLNWAPYTLSLYSSPSPKIATFETSVGSPAWVVNTRFFSWLEGCVIDLAAFPEFIKITLFSVCFTFIGFSTNESYWNALVKYDGNPS